MGLRSSVLCPTLLDRFLKNSSRYCAVSWRDWRCFWVSVLNWKGRLVERSSAWLWRSEGCLSEVGDGIQRVSQSISSMSVGKCTEWAFCAIRSYLGSIVVVMVWQSELGVAIRAACSYRKSTYSSYTLLSSSACTFLSDSHTPNTANCCFSDYIHPPINLKAYPNDFARSFSLTTSRQSRSMRLQQSAAMVSKKGEFFMCSRKRAAREMSWWGGLPRMRLQRIASRWIRILMRKSSTLLESCTSIVSPFTTYITASPSPTPSSPSAPSHTRSNARLRPITFSPFD